jgi:hypothetical protein
VVESGAVRCIPLKPASSSASLPAKTGCQTVFNLQSGRWTRMFRIVLPVGPRLRLAGIRKRRQRVLDDAYAAPTCSVRVGAAGLLSGLLAATRTGLSPAGDDELTNTGKDTMAYVRVSLPVLLGTRKRLSARRNFKEYPTSYPSQQYALSRCQSAVLAPLV